MLESWVPGKSSDTRGLSGYLFGKAGRKFGREEDSIEYEALRETDIRRFEKPALDGT